VKMSMSVTEGPIATGVPAQESTIWGLTPAQVHDRYWAARGVQVVRQGQRSEVVEGAELYLLLDPRSLVTFGLRDLVETLSWLQPSVLMLRLRDSRTRGFREEALAGEAGGFLRFHRTYDTSHGRLARVGLTPDRDIARRWQSSESTRTGWKEIRRWYPPDTIAGMSVPGRVFDTRDGEEQVGFVRHLIALWKRPDSTIHRIRKIPGGGWADQGAKVAADASFEGPAWVGAAREIKAGTIVIGPSAVWDDPTARPKLEDVEWESLEPLIATQMPAAPPKRSVVRRGAKRLFDIVFSLFALVLTLPLWPFICLAIVLEDGRPIFFGHRRESMGGREFSCLKFRSMRKGSEKQKADVQNQNLADGPQVYVKDDPRATRIGRILRKTHLDELPQFLNVLMGHMSVVGPRPSPRDENQFCPAWREARLSVRPGITGLWQVRRTREEGKDFQEWIKYDLSYVERSSWRLDLWIMWQTAVLLVLGRK
jgi:lipopolysaccharide/colanic/teichoic acid biosynthesis glycosyltransferase